VELLRFKFKNSEKVEGNFFYIQPQTLNIKSSQPNAKTFTFKMCGTFELGVQKLLKVPNAKTFAFNYNFRCRKFVVKHEKTYVWHMVELPSSKFKSSTKGQVQFFLHLATNYWCQKLVAKHKKLTFGMFQNFQAWSSKVPIGAKSKCFCIQPFCKLAEAKHIFLVISLLWIF
jgi:hypothetical protein